MPRPFRFAKVAAPSTPFTGLIEHARAAEPSGFDLLVLPDFPNAISRCDPRGALLTPTPYGSSPLVVNTGLWQPDLLVRGF